jgi:hypothetical protein
MKQVATTELDATTKCVIDLLVKLLSHENDDQRRDATSRILQMAIAPARNLLVDRLVDILGQRSERLRQRAAASLTEMGMLVTSALQYRLVKTRSTALQVRLIKVLACIGRAVSPAHRVPIQVDLDIAFAFARNSDVYAALAQAQTDLCPTK